MSFQLSEAVDKDKVFLVKRSELEDVWNTEFYKPEFLENRERLKQNKFGLIKLQNITSKITKGETPLWRGDDYLKEGVRFVKSENVLENELNIFSTDFVSKEVHLRMKRSQLSEGDVLLNIVGASIGRACVYNKDDEANINQAVCLIRLIDGYNPYWLSSLLTTTPYKTWINQLKSGGARDNIDLGQVRNFLVPNHPPEIQDKIISIVQKSGIQKKEKEAQAQQLLDSIDTYLLNELGIETKTNYQCAIENRIVKSSFKSFTGQRWDPLFHCGDIFSFVRNAQPRIDLPPLNNLVLYFQSGFAAGRGDQGDERGGIIQIRPTNINDNRELVFHRNVYIDASELHARKADVLKRDEVLFNNTNSQEQVGKTSYFDLEGDYFCSNHITRIATKAELLNPKYLCYILNLYQHQKCFFKLCTNWNNQSGVGVDVLQKIPIPLPPLERQNEIAAHFQAIRDQAKQLRAEAATGLEQAKREVEAMILGKL